MCQDMRAPVVSPTMGNHPASTWSAGGVPTPNHDRFFLPPFSRPLSRYCPLLDRPSLLCLWCADETSSAQWTICVPSLHLLTWHREDASKERSMGSCAPHASISSLAARTSSCSGGGTGPAQLRFLPSTLLLDMKH